MTYPTPGSIAARIRESTEADLVDWLGKSLPGAPHDIVSYETFLPPGAIEGMVRWTVELEDGPTVVSARFPPLEERPQGIVLAFEADYPWPSLPARLERLGTPVPETDPTLVLKRDALEHRLTTWLPGPADLTHLSFAVRVRAEKLRAMVTLEWGTPDDAPAFDFDGILIFDTIADVVRRKANRMLPPGSPRARRLL